MTATLEAEVILSLVLPKHLLRKLIRRKISSYREPCFDVSFDPLIPSLIGKTALMRETDSEPEKYLGEEFSPVLSFPRGWMRESFHVEIELFKKETVLGTRWLKYRHLLEKARANTWLT